ncbi:hypothetical protein [Paludisphaera borealis]|uniref:Uncharacterized protein n=1 Tax=Paludisphaera borealis TaxID=1387353 RepID=A0A1U7CV68_9BACT|nr:hypothetical protein [Paludisphaera borealis]APW62840.1 hypothetical protein BSF38_04394 [Paludisphaera borealis]
MNPHSRAIGLAVVLSRAAWVQGALVVLSAFSATTAFGQSFRAAGDAPGAVCAGPPTLGTFEPTPYIMVGGASPIGGGYSPLGIYGDGSMALSGPFSPMRSKSAPVMTYSRGYDGVVRGVPGVSFSNPNLPALSPVVYPTPRSNYYAPRVNRTPSWWSSGVNWIDQN